LHRLLEGGFNLVFAPSDAVLGGNVAAGRVGESHGLAVRKARVRAGNSALLEWSRA
jgi:hypothetical protein